MSMQNIINVRIVSNLIVSIVSVSGISSLIHSVSLAIHVSTHLLIQLSAHVYYHHHSHHPSLLDIQLTLSLQAQTYLFNKSFPP